MENTTLTSFSLSFIKKGKKGLKSNLDMGPAVEHGQSIIINTLKETDSSFPICYQMHIVPQLWSILYGYFPSSILRFVWLEYAQEFGDYLKCCEFIFRTPWLNLKTVCSFSLLPPLFLEYFFPHFLKDP